MFDRLVHRIVTDDKLDRDLAERITDQALAFLSACAADTGTLAVAVWGIWEYQRGVQPRALWRQLTPAARAAAHHRLAVVG